MKTTLLRNLSASTILIGALGLVPNFPLAISAAHAQVNVSADFNIGTFYDRLQPYGYWTSYHGRYVWVPNRVDTGWRPYTRGHWVFTDEYGWLWASAEPFGWATYHYGRWGYEPAFGWYWVPGQRWAPAWVAWSRTDDDVAWAPLPPRYDDNDVDINISVGDVPDYYWEAVPVSAFLSINFSNDFIRDRNRVHDVIRQGGPQSVRFRNNVAVNNFIDPAFIEQRTGKKVDRIQARPVNSPDQAGKPGDQGGVGIFNPKVNEQGNFQPKKTSNIDQIASDRKQRGFKPLADKGTQPPAPLPGQGDVNTGNNAGDGNPPSQPGVTDQNGTKVFTPPSGKKKNLNDNAPGNPPSTLDNSGQQPMQSGEKDRRNKFDNNGNPQTPQIDTGNSDNNAPVQQMRKRKPMDQGQGMGQPQNLPKFNGGQKFNNGQELGQPNMPMRQKKLGAPDMNNGGQPKPDHMPGINKNNGGQNPNFAPDQGKGKNNGAGGPPPPQGGEKDKVPCDPNAGACPPAQ